MEYISADVRDTQRLATRLGELAAPGTVLVLEGPLGAGKTSFVQGLAKGLGITEVVNSPTFTLIKEYSGRIPLYHFDFYRLQTPAELWDLGFDEYLAGEGVCALEWGERFLQLLPQEFVQISIDYGGGSQRRISLKPFGVAACRLVKELETIASAGD